MKLEAYKAQENYEDSHWWFQARAKIVSYLITPLKGNILDFGCGTGLMLRKLQQTNSSQIHIFGADHSSHSLDVCRKIPGITLFDLRTDSNLLNQKKYDVILCMDVLEHIEEQDPFLENLNSLLATNGRLLLTVPAYEFLWSGEDFVSHHIRRYTQNQLRKTLEKYFDIQYISYFNFFLLPVILSYLFFLRLFMPKSMYETNVKPTSHLANTILEKIFSFERFLLKYVSFPVGHSIIVICNKKLASK